MKMVKYFAKGKKGGKKELYKFILPEGQISRKRKEVKKE